MLNRRAVIHDTQDNAKVQNHWYEPTMRRLDLITEWDEQDVVSDWLYLYLF